MVCCNIKVNDVIPSSAFLGTNWVALQSLGCDKKDKRPGGTAQGDSMPQAAYHIQGQSMHSMKCRQGMTTQKGMFGESCPDKPCRARAGQSRAGQGRAGVP